MAISTLIELLERLDEVHLQMLDLAASKKQAIMDNKVDDLIEIMNRESKMVRQIESLEAQRAEAAYSFLQGVGIRSNLNLNLTELSRLVFDPEEKARLLEVRDQLSGTLTRLKKAADLNKLLIEQSLAYIDYSVDLMVERPNQDVTYQHPASRVHEVQRPGFFDARG